MKMSARRTGIMTAAVRTRVVRLERAWVFTEKGGAGRSDA
jgi:hypothetical protein